MRQAILGYPVRDQFAEHAGNRRPSQEEFLPGRAPVGHGHVVADLIVREMSTKRLGLAGGSVQDQGIRPDENKEIRENVPFFVAEECLTAVPGGQVIELVRRQPVQEGRAARARYFQLCAGQG